MHPVREGSNRPPERLRERALSLITEIRSGEGTTACLLMANMFVLLTAYYIVKPVREALILGSAGAEIKAYAGAGQALLFLFLVPLYGILASRVNRIKLINGMTAFFISNLVLFYFLAVTKVNIGVLFFLWVGIFNLMLVAQFWAFATDVYTERQGRRLFAVVGIGSAFGAIFGARLSGWLFKPVGAYNMMLLTAALLGVCMILTNWIHHRESDSKTARSPQEVDRTLNATGGFQLIRQHPYLVLIAIVVLLSNFVNTTGEFILGKTVTDYARTAATGAAGGVTAEQYIGGFYATFYFWVNLLTALLQLFLVSRVMKYLGPRIALFFLPAIALGGYGLLAFAPMLGVIRTAKILENSTDYSIQNTARHALFLDTSREAKYKAQTAIESFFWRIGDALSGLVVFVGTQLAFKLTDYALVNVAVVIVWFAIAVGLARFHVARPETTRRAA